MFESREPQVDTRGRLLTLLCSGNRTAGELADELGISANGVRGHLRQLEAEGLVAYRVVRQGVGKPAHEYRLTALGSVRLSRAYLPVLSALLTALQQDGSAGDTELLLGEVGRGLARQQPPSRGAPRERVHAAARLLEQLGAVCVVRSDEGRLSIAGACCPLRALVPDHPQVCKVVEALVEEYTGLPTRERCEKEDPPSCRLVIGTAP